MNRYLWYGRKLKLQIFKIERQIFWKHVWNFNIFQQIMNIKVLYFYLKRLEIIL